VPATARVRAHRLVVVHCADWLAGLAMVVVACFPPSRTSAGRHSFLRRCLPAPLLTFLWSSMSSTCRSDRSFVEPQPIANERGGAQGSQQLWSPGRLDASERKRKRNERNKKKFGVPPARVVCVGSVCVRVVVTVVSTSVCVSVAERKAVGQRDAVRAHAVAAAGCCVGQRDRAACAASQTARDRKQTKKNLA
jgi:hypothetical protein